ncbi:uncharacterized protein LOC130803856 isoform X2 [Amaranthus tricolor]|uniref:uncharacterized protein LOC130803856 isoform X2 n=1 Tax=Amaranthus tricolor TaxID=29722 RepID=UPI00258F9EE6|nr:uncharacterized protein LOC130803856 isoform X2 [Amaranthus tricolor]XP_057524051.1 uncharacterized protein LOC130803856 isoform X2 [Amaranthus tricolor]
MLMEDREEKCHGTENAEKSMSLDLQSANSKKNLVSGLSTVTKRGSRNRCGGSNSVNSLKRKIITKNQNESRKKSKKEVLLSSLPLRGNNKKSDDDVLKFQVNSGSIDIGKAKVQENVEVDVSNGALGGISSSLNGKINIPKRPRGLVRRKKVEVGFSSKQEGTFSDKFSLVDRGKVNGNADANLMKNDIGNGKLAQGGESEGTSNGAVIENRKKKNSYDQKESRSDSPDLLRHLKRDASHSSLHNGESVAKKARRNVKKNKETRNKSPMPIVEAKQSMDESNRNCDDSQDDEENLEANAARMLSSRFDPSCMGHSTGGKRSKVPSSNGLSALISSNKSLVIEHPNSIEEFDIASSDAEARALPKDQPKVKRFSRNQPYFYEVSGEFDSFWVLNRRIKIFWPSDQSWYLGYVVGYNVENKLHHVKYDDREEELIDLQRARFKLLLLPNEVPGKDGRKRENAYLQKRKHDEASHVEEEPNGNCMETEPISLWLARSTHRKSPHSKAKKKKRTMVKSQSSSFSGVKFEPPEKLEAGSSGHNVDHSTCVPALSNITGEGENKLIKENVLNNRTLKVYIRRRFHRRKESPSSVLEGCQVSVKPQLGKAPNFVDSIEPEVDRLFWIGGCGDSAGKMSNDEVIWDTDCSGLLKLVIPVTSMKVFKFDLSFQLPVVDSIMVGWPRHMFMLQHGTLISAWPIIHLEILFVDNIDGLRFLLFEGCMKQAVAFVFLVLAAFYQPGQKEWHDDQQLPMTSIRFRFCGFQCLANQLVFTIYNFSEVADSMWLYLDRKLIKRCILSKQLLPSDCTYDNIKSLRKGCNLLRLTNVSQKPSSVFNLKENSRHCGTSISSRQSACVKLSRLDCDSVKKLGSLPPFALSFSATPKLFLGLHLRLLMEQSIPSSSFRELDPLCLIDHPDCEATALSSLPIGGNSPVVLDGRSEWDSCSGVDLGVKISSSDPAEGTTTKPSCGPQDFVTNDEVLPLGKGKAQLTGSDDGALPLVSDSHLCKVDDKGKGSHLNGLTVEIQSFVPDERVTQKTIDSSLDTNDKVCRLNPTVSRSMLGKTGISNFCSSPSSPGWVDRKQDFLRRGFSSGPKKRRTQVSYSLPCGGQDYSPKNKFQQSRGLFPKRIRRASEKKTSEAKGTSQRNMELLSCGANLLVNVGDRGWRECGAMIVLELLEHNEWRLAVKISGNTRYSYKAHQFVQPGTTNRYTHAMMWKGGKDWILEFPDRSQWTIFKEMHEECYNRNFRASLVKNIPIPGVREVEELDNNVSEVPYIRPSPKYYQQMENDIEIAMDPSRALYDMDSDDEQWIKHRDSDLKERGCEHLSDEIFEKTIDVLEKMAYAKQRDHFTVDELEEALAKVGPLEAIKLIYEHWRVKRQRKGMPLVRHLQPPLWEKYQRQVKEWEMLMANGNLPLSSGCPEKPLNVDKPPMFAFCLKPRGLEVPNRGSKQRSQKKLPVGALINGVAGDGDAFHSLDDRFCYTAYNQGTSDSSPILQASTRVFSPSDSGSLGYFSLSSDGYERSHYPKLYRSKLKDQPCFASYGQSTPSKRGLVHSWNSPEWPSRMHYQPDGFQIPRHNFEKLDPSELDEFRLRDASSAARHAATMARMKKDNARRMLCRADLAMHKAVSAIMTADAVKASRRELPDIDVQMSG